MVSEGDRVRYYNPKFFKYEGYVVSGPIWCNRYVEVQWDDFCMVVVEFTKNLVKIEDSHAQSSASISGNIPHSTSNI